MVAWLDERGAARVHSPMRPAPLSGSHPRLVALSAEKLDTSGADAVSLDSSVKVVFWTKTSDSGAFLGTGFLGTGFFGTGFFGTGFPSSLMWPTRLPRSSLP